MAHLFDWSGAPELSGKLICSACGPTNYNDGSVTKYGKWHNAFSRTFLPKGMFITNRVGNLAHKDTGDEDFMKYEIHGEDK